MLCVVVYAVCTHMSVMWYVVYGIVEVHGVWRMSDMVCRLVRCGGCAMCGMCDASRVVLWCMYVVWCVVCVGWCMIVVGWLLICVM